MPPPLKSLTRSLGLGLSGGLILSALMLVLWALTLSMSGCGELVGEDCALAEELSSELALGLTGLAFGLMLMGVGSFLHFRSKSGAA